MIERCVNLLTTAARGIFLMLLAGLLIARREFAHLNLGDPAIWKWLNASPPKVASYLFITETTLLEQREHGPADEAGGTENGDAYVGHGVGPGTG